MVRVAVGGAAVGLEETFIGRERGGASVDREKAFSCAACPSEQAASKVKINKNNGNCCFITLFANGFDFFGDCSGEQ